LRVESHSQTASFRQNLSLTLAWGLVANEDFREAWANGFPDPHASSSYVDFFYNGSLVYREVYVTVDGGRVSLPLPEERDGKLFAARAYSRLCKLLMSFESGYLEKFDDSLTRAGIVLVDEPWPT
jgi:hypothetical protein